MGVRWTEITWARVGHGAWLGRVVGWVGDWPGMGAGLGWAGLS
jgi:hypothetical protein